MLHCAQAPGENSGVRPNDCHARPKVVWGAGNTTVPFCHCASINPRAAATAAWKSGGGGRGRGASPLPGRSLMPILTQWAAVKSPSHPTQPPFLPRPGLTLSPAWAGLVTSRLSRARRSETPRESPGSPSTEKYRPRVLPCPHFGAERDDRHYVPT